MATATKKKPVKVPEIETNGGLIRIEVVCQGVSPLLMNRMPPAQLEALWTKEKPAKTASRPLPREHAEKCLHTLPNGKACIPPGMLMSALIGAGQFIRLDGKRQISTQKTTTLPGFLTIEDTEIPLDHAKPWEVDMQQGRNPNGGEAVCIVRPRFDAWSFRVTQVVDTTQINLVLVRQLWDYAGQRMGLGDFRPQRKGTYGRFVIVGWEVL